MLDAYINFPDKFFVLNDPSNPATQIALDKMLSDILEVKKICDTNNCRMIFANLPQNSFVGHEVSRYPLIELTEQYLLEHNHVDSMYASVARRAGIGYLQLTDHFRQLPDKTAYFYRYDAHPTEKGHQEMANCIGNYLINDFKGK
jgi:hypothetical protein